MVRRVIEIMYKEVRGLHQAAYVLGAFALGSQILALFRDRLLAHEFGAGMELDLYYAAFRIPDVMYVLFASTLSVYVLIPFVASRITNEDASQARQLLSQIFSTFLLLYVVIASTLFLTAPVYAPLLFPGLIDQIDTLVLLIRILLLQPLLLGISSLFGVVTQLGHRFILYAISPLLYNVGIIAGIVLFYPMFGISGLAWGVVLGALGHMLVQLPLVRGSDLSFGFTSKISWRLIREVLYVSIPRAVTLGLNQIVLLILIGMASVMSVGSVAVFQFAFNLQSVPLAIIGASYSIAAFPMLADLFAQKKMDEFRVHIVTALRHIIFWSVPIIGLVIVLRAQLVRVVLGSGAFDWSDTRLTAAVLALLVISLFAQAINLLIIRAFYAGSFTKIPFFITLATSVFAIGFTAFLHTLYISSPQFAYTLATLLRVTDVSGSEVMVIGLGYSVAIVIQMILLFIFAAKKFKLQGSILNLHIVRSFSAASVGALSAYATLNFFVDGINNETFLGIFIQGLFGGVVGLFGVILTYYVLKSPELHEALASFHAKLFKTDVIAPQEDVL